MSGHSMKALALSSSDTDLIHISSGYVLGSWSDLRSRTVTERRLSKTFSLIRGPIEFNPILAPPRSVTRGLGHRKSDVSDLRPFKVPELGNTRVLVVHLLRIKILAKGMDCTKVGCFRLWLF